MDRYQLFQIYSSFNLLCVLIFLFWFLELKVGFGGAGGGVLLAVLPTFQLVTELTEEKIKR